MGEAGTQSSASLSIVERDADGRIAHIGVNKTTGLSHDEWGTSVIA